MNIIKYARTIDNRVVHIDSVKSQGKSQYYCLKCNGELIPKLGEIKQHHFAHKVASDCDPTIDSTKYNSRSYQLNTINLGLPDQKKLDTLIYKLRDIFDLESSITLPSTCSVLDIEQVGRKYIVQLSPEFEFAYNRTEINSHNNIKYLSLINVSNFKKISLVPYTFAFESNIEGLESCDEDILLINLTNLNNFYNIKEIKEQINVKNLTWFKNLEQKEVSALINRAVNTFFSILPKTNEFCILKKTDHIFNLSEFKEVIEKQAIASNCEFCRFCISITNDQDDQLNSRCLYNSTDEYIRFLSENNIFLIDSDNTRLNVGSINGVKKLIEKDLLENYIIVEQVNYYNKEQFKDLCKSNNVRYLYNNFINKYILKKNDYNIIEEQLQSINLKK